MQDLQDYIAQALVFRGFEKQSVQDELLMLCEEVGELAKAIRQSQNKPKATDSESFEVVYEVADVIWMTLPIARRLGISAEQAVRDKEEKNQKRTWQQP
jgi:NTP pyrophosphatase (non-canonical NTP hydrolase)